jgi:hypothetical protein
MIFPAVKLFKVILSSTGSKRRAEVREGFTSGWRLNIERHGKACSNHQNGLELI